LNYWYKIHEREKVEKPFLQGITSKPLIWKIKDYSFKQIYFLEGED